MYDIEVEGRLLVLELESKQCQWLRACTVVAQDMRSVPEYTPGSSILSAAPALGGPVSSSYFCGYLHLCEHTPLYHTHN